MEVSSCKDGGHTRLSTGPRAPICERWPKTRVDQPLHTVEKQRTAIGFHGGRSRKNSENDVSRFVTCRFDGARILDFSFFQKTIIFEKIGSDSTILDIVPGCKNCIRHHLIGDLFLAVLAQR
jgi:hypothetical protein